MTAIRLHASELAYLFSYANTADIVGWGRDPFLPAATAQADPNKWYASGAERLAAANWLVEVPGEGATLDQALTEMVLALVDPALVFMSERKAEDGVRRMTVHVKDDTLVGMVRHADGMFELTAYVDITAAAAASAAFLGTARLPVQAGTRIDTTLEHLNGINALASNGQPEKVIAGLEALGASTLDATSIASAMTSPVASGVLSILYCVENTARDAQPYSVMTNTDDETWIIFPPASLRGPMSIERSSLTALTGRVTISVAARLKMVQQSEA
ncbi:hypothetical protein Z946_3992 [Sulfitobacter noctilucicola]|uniref:ESX secretion-associated protein EspG n=1 Tax=Sulfitobacter noctilucicola TaxID=1342301 RepID=A0A7W6Q438_9RHOB|nr:hypothetical protein [Sulfitobacter noctilucicola]KIN65092.1 hypothetical protein Z946_3992 [Sulfitobacter noctilucicola]MBB4173769.1 hypothetical protein [Sulfitobacter noctilucicola]